MGGDGEEIWRWNVEVEVRRDWTRRFREKPSPLISSYLPPSPSNRSTQPVQRSPSGRRVTRCAGWGGPGHRGCLLTCLHLRKEMGGDGEEMLEMESEVSRDWTRRPCEKPSPLISSPLPHLLQTRSTHPVQCSPSRRRVTRCAGWGGPGHRGCLLTFLHLRKEMGGDGEEMLEMESRSGQDRTRRSREKPSPLISSPLPPSPSNRSTQPVQRSPRSRSVTPRSSPHLPISTASPHLLYQRRPKLPLSVKPRPRHPLQDRADVISGADERGSPPGLDELDGGTDLGRHAAGREHPGV